MKKFLSMVMAAAMVVSLVPATAFAATNNAVTASIMDAQNYVKPSGNTQTVTVKDAELRLRTTSNFVTSTKEDPVKTEVTLTLDNAYFADAQKTEDASGWVGKIAIDDGDNVYRSKMNNNNDKLVFKDGTESLKDRVTNAPFEVAVTDTDFENGNLVEVTLEITGRIYRGWDIYFSLDSTMDKVSKGTTATVTVDSDDLDITGGDDLVYASIEGKGIKASVKKTVDVATEEIAELKEIKIEPSVGDTLEAAGLSGKEIKLKLSSGFEFVESKGVTLETNLPANQQPVTDKEWDDDELILKNIGSRVTDAEWLKITGLYVEATSAKAGSTATIKVYADGCDTVSVEVAKVVDYTVSMTVDEDEDVPVIYSGVNVENDGIVDDSDHESLEVTIEETFAGAWNNSKDFTLSVPEGVYVVDVADANFDNDGGPTDPADEKAWFAKAYNEGDYVDLTFKRRTWEETRPDASPKQDPAELTFTLVLVADPNFEGDVTLKLTGDAVDEQEVTIAKFVKPFTVEAQQNDMQIDYRNTEIPTSVVIKEAEAGLWDKDTKFTLSLDKIDFDDEGTITVDDKSGLEVKDDEVKYVDVKDGNDALYFTVSSRSDDEPAVVTISGMQLYMDRSLPAGAYDLKVYSDTMLGNDKDKDGDNGAGYLGENVLGAGLDKDVNSIADINDDFYSTTAKAGFVNIITAGREDTDSFTTKVVVPVGESYLISGENKVEIPVPAYINAAGYTMLPLRAVAVALGINENNVLWDQASRTATVMYGSKIINMTLGQKVVYVNGAMIPATAAVEITNDRMFLGLRDLGTALGVTDITWDGATRTATLNGNK